MRYTPKSSKTLILTTLFVLLSLGCGLTDRLANLRGADNTLATRTPMPTFTPTAAGQAFIEVPVVIETEAVEVANVQDQQQTETIAIEPVSAEPSATPVPIEEPSPTPEPQSVNETVTATVLNDMNVRGGPGTGYPVLGNGPAGASSRVVGRNADASWLQVEYPPGSSSTGWLYTELIQVSGDPQTVQVVQVDPPPQSVAAAQPAAQPQAEAPPPEPEQPKYQFTPTGWHASENAAIVHFKGRIKDEAGNLVNGYSVRLDNWSFSIISHPTGASGWYPEKGDGEWDVSGVPLGAAQGWWWLSVVRYECDFWAGFDSQCKNFTTLSEEVKIEVRTPEESVINADWICHWDCDKGLYTEGFRR